MTRVLDLADRGTRGRPNKVVLVSNSMGCPISRGVTHHAPDGF